MNLRAREITRVALFTALTAVGAMVTIPIGPTPITMQSIFVLLSGLVLGAKLGALSQLLYVFIGLLGLPVFSGFRGGLQVIYGPTFGYLLGFILASYLIGKITYKEGKFLKNRVFVACIIGSLIISLLGLIYMYLILNIFAPKPTSVMQIVKIGFIIFLPGDIFKMILAGLIARKIVPILQKSV